MGRRLTGPSRRAAPICRAFASSPLEQGGEDVVVLDELGEAEQQVSTAELRVELGVRVRRRPRDDVLAVEHAEEVDLAVTEVRRLAVEEVVDLLPERWDEPGRVRVEAVGQVEPAAEPALIGDRAALVHSGGFAFCGRTGGPSVSLLVAVKRSS